MYGLDLEEDGGKNMAAELMYTTHSKLYGFNDRHDDQEKGCPESPSKSTASSGQP